MATLRMAFVAKDGSVHAEREQAAMHDLINGVNEIGVAFGVEFRKNLSTVLTLVRQYDIDKEVQNDDPN